MTGPERSASADSGPPLLAPPTPRRSVVAFPAGTQDPAAGDADTLAVDDLARVTKTRGADE